MSQFHEKPEGGPLSGIRILDLTRVVMGPLATQILGDQGADVILVEAKGGDTNRVMGPGPHPELSGIALNLLRNKRSIDVDLQSAEGRATIHQLVRSCDVVITTMRPQALAKLGVDYETLKAIRPDLIYCQAQGFRLDGPRAEEPAYDDIIQSASGVADVMRRVTGESALAPTILADKVCGLVMAQAVCAALVHRERSGMGQHIEVPMQQAMSAFMLAEHGAGAIAEPPAAADGREAAGYPRVLSRERRPHPTKDGEVHLFPYLPQHYERLFAGAAMLEGDADRYRDMRSTLLNSDSLYRDVRALAPSRTTREWLEFCREEGIPATRVETLQDLVDVLPLSEHGTAGKYRVIPPMSIFSATPGGLYRHAPLIGEHTDEVLTGPESE